MKPLKEFFQGTDGKFSIDNLNKVVWSAAILSICTVISIAKKEFVPIDSSYLVVLSIFWGFGTVTRIGESLTLNKQNSQQTNPPNS